MECLPYHVVLLISNLLDKPSILNLSRTSRALNLSYLPELYRSIAIKYDSSKAPTLLSNVSRCAQRAGWIRNLKISCLECTIDSPLGGVPDSCRDAITIAAMRLIVKCSRLVSLQYHFDGSGNVHKKFFDLAK